MEFLGKIENSKDLTTQEYVVDYVQADGGKINKIVKDGQELPISASKVVTFDTADKVNKSVIGQNGTALISNAGEGAALQFTHTDGTKSRIEVKDGGNNGISARISAVKDGQGVYLNVENNAMYYVKGTDRAVTADDEIVTAGNIPHPYFSAVKKETAEAGYFATYYIADKDGEKCGVYINIPKDFLVKKAEMGTVTLEDKQEGGKFYGNDEFSVGDKYIDFTINVKEGETEESHIYINVSTLVDVYTAGNGININANNVISAEVVSANGLTLDADGIKLSLASTGANGAMSAAQVTKLNGISENAKRVANSAKNGIILIDDVEEDIYVHPAGTFADKSLNLYKIATDSTSHIKEAVAMTGVDIANYLKFKTDYNETSNKIATEADVTAVSTALNTLDDSLATVAKSGSYNDLSNQPVIPTVPTNVSAFTNDAGYLTEHQDISTLTAHVADTDIHVTAQNKADWDAKAEVSIVPTNLSQLYDDATHRVVTDTEKSTWNAKADTSSIPTTLAQLTDDENHRLVTDTEKSAWGKTAAVINVTNPVGTYQAGDTIAAGTSLEEILRNILTATV